MANQFEITRSRPIPDERVEVSEGMNEYHTEHGILDVMDRKRSRMNEETLKEQVKRAEEFECMEGEIAARKRYRDALRFEMNPKIIRKMARTPDERRVCAEVYTEIVAERLEGIGAMRVYLLNALTQNPDAEVESLKDAVLSIAEQHNISRDAVLETFLSFFKQYRLRRDIMSRKSDSDIERDATEKKIAIEQIYRDTFSIFIVGPKTTDTGHSNRGGGGSYWPFYEGGIYSHASAPLHSVNSENTRIHEGQHALYKLEHSQETDAFFHESMDSSLHSARDEILAHLRASNGSFLGTSFLLPDYKLYSGGCNPYEYMHKNLSEENKEKYASYLRQGDIAAQRLLKSKRLGVEEVIGILSRTPLQRWGVVADRIIDAKDSTEKYGRIIDRLRRFADTIRKLRSYE